jgi:hypothetical protein
MATIQVYKTDGTTLLGAGDGSIDSKAQEATIQTWKDKEKAAVQVGTKYKLKSSGATYDATCSAIGSVAPVASFNNVT